MGSKSKPPQLMASPPSPLGASIPTVTKILSSCVPCCRMAISIVFTPDRSFGSRAGAAIHSKSSVTGRVSSKVNQSCSLTRTIK